MECLGKHNRSFHVHLGLGGARSAEKWPGKGCEGKSGAGPHVLIISTSVCG